MTRTVCTLSGFLFAGSLLAADTPKKAKIEPMAQDRFAEAHAPLFQPPPSKDAGALTERVAPSRPGVAAADRMPRRNFIDEFIFAKMERDGVPHAPIAS